MPGSPGRITRIAWITRDSLAGIACQNNLPPSNFYRMRAGGCRPRPRPGSPGHRHPARAGANALPAGGLANLKTPQTPPPPPPPEALRRAAAAPSRGRGFSAFVLLAHPGGPPSQSPFRGPAPPAPPARASQTPPRPPSAPAGPPPIRPAALRGETETRGGNLRRRGLGFPSSSPGPGPGPAPWTTAPSTRGNPSPRRRRCAAAGNSAGDQALPGCPRQGPSGPDLAARYWPGSPKRPAAGLGDGPEEDGRGRPGLMLDNFQNPCLLTLPYSSSKLVVCALLLPWGSAGHVSESLRRGIYGPSLIEGG